MAEYIDIEQAKTMSGLRLVLPRDALTLGRKASKASVM